MLKPDKTKTALPSDAPITDPAGDALGRETHAQQITEHLASVGTPFVMCISGEWGSGKTSFLHFVEKKTHKQYNWESVWAYPWRYVSAAEAEKAVLSAIWGKLLVGPLEERLKRWGKRRWRLLVPAGMGMIAEALGRVRASEATQLVERLLSPDSPMSAEVHQQLREDAEKYFAKKKGGARLLVLIDDLDRCQEEVARTVLQSIHLHAQVPRLVFLVGADLNAVKSALDSGKSAQREGGCAFLLGAEGAPAGGQGPGRPGSGQPLVEKIFQQVWPLPAPRQRDFEGFQGRLLEFVPKAWRPNKDLWQRAVHALNENPRRIKRYVFSLRLAALTAQGRGKSHIDKDKLAGTVLLSHLLEPEVYASVCREPELLLSAQTDGDAEPSSEALEPSGGESRVGGSRVLGSGLSDPRPSDPRLPSGGEAAAGPSQVGAEHVQPASFERRTCEFIRAMPKFKDAAEVLAHLRSTGVPVRWEQT
jgi:hypothetical protein